MFLMSRCFVVCKLFKQSQFHRSAPVYQILAYDFDNGACRKLKHTTIAVSLPAEFEIRQQKLNRVGSQSASVTSHRAIGDLGIHAFIH